MESAKNISSPLLLSVQEVPKALGVGQASENTNSIAADEIIQWQASA